MSKFTITNTTKNKIVLNSVEAADAIGAVGKYLSVLMVAGIIGFNQKEVVFEEGSSANFSISTKGWNFTVEQVA